MTEKGRGYLLTEMQENRNVPVIFTGDFCAGISQDSLLPETRGLLTGSGVLLPETRGLLTGSEALLFVGWLGSGCVCEFIGLMFRTTDEWVWKEWLVGVDECRSLGGD
jgi:hypothetical protein